MPRYFFHVHDGGPVADMAGVDLADIPEARAYAIEAAARMLRDAAIRSGQPSEWRMDVTDAAATTVLKLRFSSDGADFGEDGVGPMPIRLGDRAIAPEEERLLRLYRSIDTDELKETILELLETISAEADSGRVRP